MSILIVHVHSLLGVEYYITVTTVRPTDLDGQVQSLFDRRLVVFVGVENFETWFETHSKATLFAHEPGLLLPQVALFPGVTEAAHLTQYRRLLSVGGTWVMKCLPVSLSSSDGSRRGKFIFRGASLTILPDRKHYCPAAFLLHHI